jgi:hypothetical protein
MVQGWSEAEFADRSLMAPCGLYCGVCGVYLATRNGDDKFKALLGRLYGSAPEETECRGCMQPDPPQTMYGYCRVCPIRDCVRGRGFYSCHQCAEWPCGLVTGFPIATGRRVMQRAIPRWRDRVAGLGVGPGDVAWARAEGERYHCPHCGEPLFRGAQRCRACKAAVADALDGSL